MNNPRARVHVKPPASLPPVRFAGLCQRCILVLLFEGRSNEYVRAALTFDDLPSPSDVEVDTMRAQFVPKTFKPKSVKGAALLEELGIAPFMQMTDEAKATLALLRHARARELVEAGLIAHVPLGAIARTLDVCLKYRVAPALIALYRDTFFDVNSVARSQLRALVHTRVRVAVERVADPTDEVASRRAITSDARIVALSLPSSVLSWASILMAAGHAPRRHELVDVVAQIEGLAGLRVTESLLRGEPGDERRAEAFASVLARIREIGTTVVTPETQLSKQLTSFRLQHQAKALITVQELRAAGGEVTVDIGPPLTGSKQPFADARDVAEDSVNSANAPNDRG